MEWKQVLERIDREIKVGTLIPKTKGGDRKITRKEGDRIYMRTGVETEAEKYITKDMIRFAYETVNQGRCFSSILLKKNFPREYSQGSCVFSMTGGILEKLGIAVKECKGGNRYVYSLRD